MSATPSPVFVLDAHPVRRADAVGTRAEGEVELTTDRVVELTAYRPSMPLILFVSWMLPICFLAADGALSHPHARSYQMLFPVAVMSLLMCVPVTAFMCMVFSLLVKMFAPLGARLSFALRRRYTRRHSAKLADAHTPLTAVVAPKFAAPSIAVPLGAALGSAAGFGHLTGWISYEMYAHRFMFFLSVAVTGAAVGALMGMRHERPHRPVWRSRVQAFIGLFSWGTARDR